jgi:hypothetical protein
MKILKILSFLLILYWPDSSAQLKNYYLAWFTPSNNNRINGLAIGPFLSTNDSINKHIQTINGVNTELIGRGYKLAYNSKNPLHLVESLNEDELNYADSSHFYNYRINGINLSFTGTYNELARVNGVNISGLFSYTGKVNGISICLVQDMARELNGFGFGYFASAFRKINGIQLSFIYSDANTVNGLQIAIANNANSISGIQLGYCYCNASEVNGLQLSLFRNKSENVNGVQISLFNKTIKLKGFQIGLWNKNEKRSFPLINFNF